MVVGSFLAPGAAAAGLRAAPQLGLRPTAAASGQCSWRLAGGCRSHRAPGPCRAVPGPDASEAAPGPARNASASTGSAQACKDHGLSGQRCLGWGRGRALRATHAHGACGTEQGADEASAQGDGRRHGIDAAESSWLASSVRQ